MQGLLEDHSLRTKTGGQTYLEWLHRAPPPPQSHGIEPLGVWSKNSNAPLSWSLRPQQQG